jgi:hypothetical protein
METSRGRGALILAHNRQAFLTQAIEAIKPQVDTIMVLDNASEPKLAVPDGVGTLYIEEQPPNLAKFWNMVPNGQPNHYTNVKPELGEQAGRDRSTFEAKWGRCPW